MEQTVYLMVRFKCGWLVRNCAELKKKARLPVPFVDPKKRFIANSACGSAFASSPHPSASRDSR
jgi:hypothetical protein